MLLVYLLMLAIVAVWILSMISSGLSLRWTRRDPRTRSTPRLVMALAPVWIGYFLATYHLRFSFDGDTLNMSWPFLLPLVFGLVATAFWGRAQWRISRGA